MTVPLSDEQLAAIDADVKLANEGKLIGVPRGAERFEAAVRVADFHSRTLLAEVHRLRAELAELRACDCFPNPSDHADRCPIFAAAFPDSGENW